MTNVESRALTIRLIHAATVDSRLIITTTTEMGETADTSWPINPAHQFMCLERAEQLKAGIHEKHPGYTNQAEIDNLGYVASHPRDLSRMRKWPFTHQVQDMETAIRLSWFFITSEMRTGKSKILIDAAQFLFQAGIINRVLVVAPAPVRDVWYDPELGELAKHLWMGLPAIVSEYHTKTDEWRWTDGLTTNPRLHWCVTNFEFLRSKNRLTHLLPFCGPKTLLIGDESSFVRTYDSKQTLAFLQLRRACARVWLLNGTPIFHSPLDLYSQGNILHPSILNCKGITYFKANYAIQEPIIVADGKMLMNPYPKKEKQPDGTYKKIEQPVKVITGWTEEGLEDLQKRFAPYTVRRLQAECLDLPPKLDPVIFTATLTPETWRAYTSMRDELVIWLSNGQVSLSATAAAKVMRLSQITGGFVGGIEDELPDDPEIGAMPEWMENDQAPAEKTYGVPPLTPVYKALGLQYGTKPIHLIGREKLDVLLWFLGQRLEADPNLHVVVWCRFRPELFRMLEVVSATFPQFEIGSIVGAQKKKDRLDALRLLKPETSPTGPVLVGGTAGTGSFGLDFCAAHTCITLSADYSPGKYKQMLDRLYGPGQTEPIAYFEVHARGPNGQKTIDHTIAVARQNGQDVADWTCSAWIKALQEE